MAAAVDGKAIQSCIVDAVTTSTSLESDTYGRGIMCEGIVPLRQRGEERSALARVDVAAVEMLVGGRATNLQTARAEVILANLRVQRDQMSMLLANQREREPTGEPQIGEANANLITAINQGIVQIDLFVAQARAYVDGATQTE